MIRKLEVSLAVLALVVGVAVAAAAVAENVAPEAAMVAAAAVEESASTTASEPSAAELEAFFYHLSGEQPTALAGCPAGTCNRNLDCFQQQYTCDFGTAKWCFGGPTTGCQGECGCF